MPLEYMIFDASEFLDDDQSQGELLAEAIESGDAPYIAHALGVVARAKGMTELAKRTGLSRESLYIALQAEQNPELATIMRVVEALGVTLTTKDAA